MTPSGGSDITTTTSSTTTTTSHNNHHILSLSTLGQTLASQEEYQSCLLSHCSKDQQQEWLKAIHPKDTIASGSTSNTHSRSIRVLQSLSELSSIAACPNKEEPEHHTSTSFVLEPNRVPLFEVPTQMAKGGDVHLHSFEFKSLEEDPNNQGKLIESLHVSIIYQGQFSEQEEQEYIPARLTVRLLKQLDQSSSQKDNPANDSTHIHQEEGEEDFRPIGHAPSNLQVLNTQHHLGRAAIHYHPTQPLCKGSFQILLWIKDSHRPAKYTILVSGKILHPAPNVLRQDTCRYFANEEKIQRQKERIANWKLDIRSFKKKIQWLEESVREIDGERIQCEEDIEECEIKLENDDDVDFVLENDNISVRSVQ